nr:putative ABC transporter, solute binding protein [uncultured archaeon]
MKIKTIAMLEIAIVLCLVFLVALPAITAASEIYERGPLDIFGNANEDDTIDMRDTTYIKLAIFGKKLKTDLADANHDGKVSMLDVGQTKLIILGKEKKLTYIDIFGEAETVNKPIKRLVNMGYFGPRVTRTLGARDILVATSGEPYPYQPIFYPVISKLLGVGNAFHGCDYEMILSLKPDAVQTNFEMNRFAIESLPQKRIHQEKLPGIPLISLNMREPDVLPKNLRTYGYILDKEKEADEFIDWFEGHANKIKARTEGLSKDKRPKVLLGWWGPGGRICSCVCPGNRIDQVITLSGGRNIADEIIGPDSPHYKKSSIDLDVEWLVEQNPDFIIKSVSGGKGLTGYEIDDQSEVVTARREILNLPELAHVDAVKKDHVYMVDNSLVGGGGAFPIGAAYLGKVLHPDLFEDIDPQAIHQEYVDKFCYIDFDVYEQGVFIYPPLV